MYRSFCKVLSKCMCFFQFGDEKILPNYEMALKKYEQAYEANQADSDVLLMLGMFYSYGIGCELNHTKVYLNILYDC